MGLKTPQTQKRLTFFDKHCAHQPEAFNPGCQFEKKAVN